MIEPGELHKHYRVREIASGRELWVEAWDVRYEITGDERGHYRIAPDGHYFLVRVSGRPHGYFAARLDEVEPLPDGEGLWHPSHLTFTYTLSLTMTYEGSWRQYADGQKAVA
jgi:hypothetical protein